jgi:signal transduction histidine kinase
LGFDKKFKNKVFQIFQKLHGNTWSGSGIGLPTCKKIVENHGGFITAVSEPNVGTSIKIFLPNS